MQTKNKIISLLALPLAVGSLQAATISWNVFNIADDITQISKTGTLIHARFGEQGSDAGLTINGEFFDDLSTLDSATNQDTIGARAGSFSAPNANYYQLLQRGSRDSANADTSISFSSLNIGSTYQIQVWAADSARAADDQGIVVNDGSGAVNPGTTGHATILQQVGTGGYGQYALGTFVADGTAAQSFGLRQYFTLQTTASAQAHTYVNAYQLREIGVVPEPSTTALLGLGGLALILRRRK